MKRLKYAVSRVIIWFTALSIWVASITLIAAITIAIESIAGRALWLGAIGFVALAIWAFNYEE